MLYNRLKWVVLIGLYSLISLSAIASSEGLEDPAPVINSIPKHTSPTTKPLEPDAKLIYKTINGVKLELYQFSPEGLKTTDKRPAIVFFFGGGWSGGSPSQFYAQADYFAQHGIVAFSAQYRVKSRNNTTPFESVEDAKSAVRWIRQHADELGIDPDRIIASGGSAGGHLALCTAMIDGYETMTEDHTVSCVPNAIIGFNPSLDTSKRKDNRFVRDGVTTASPMHHIKKGLPPVLIFHGTADRTVPYEHAVRFTQLMQKAGNTCQLKSFPGKTHGFFNSKSFRSKYSNQEYEQTMRDSVQFLKELNFL